MTQGISGWVSLWVPHSQAQLGFCTFQGAPSFDLIPQDLQLNEALKVPDSFVASPKPLDQVKNKAFGNSFPASKCNKEQLWNRQGKWKGVWRGVIIVLNPQWLGLSQRFFFLAGKQVDFLYVYSFHSVYFQKWFGRHRHVTNEEKRKNSLYINQGLKTMWPLPLSVSHMSDEWVRAENLWSATQCWLSVVYGGSQTIYFHAFFRGWIHCPYVFF